MYEVGAEDIWHMYIQWLARCIIFISGYHPSDDTTCAELICVPSYMFLHRTQSMLARHRRDPRCLSAHLLWVSLLDLV
jgi:hypothetical protein